MALEKDTIARPYAQAAFEFAGTSADTWLSALDALAQAYASSDVAGVLDDPTISEQARTKLVLEGLVLEGVKHAPEGPPEGFDQFVELLLVNQRFGVIAEIAGLFRRLQDAAKAVVRVEVTSAVEVSPENKAALEAKLAEKHTGNLQFAYKVVAAIGGGLHLRIGDEVCDMTVRGSLMNMADNLAIARQAPT